jgi:hypothetical protein
MGPVLLPDQGEELHPPLSTPAARTSPPLPRPAARRAAHARGDARVLALRLAAPRPVGLLVPPHAHRRARRGGDHGRGPGPGPAAARHLRRRDPALGGTGGRSGPPGTGATSRRRRGRGRPPRRRDPRRALPRRPGRARHPLLRPARLPEGPPAQGRASASRATPRSPPPSRPRSAPCTSRAPRTTAGWWRWPCPIPLPVAAEATVRIEGDFMTHDPSVVHLPSRRADRLVVGSDAMTSPPTSATSPVTPPSSRLRSLPRFRAPRSPTRRRGPRPRHSGRRIAEDASRRGRGWRG